MNVLLTSAGRRTSLLQAFKSCAHEIGGRVWAGDMDPLAPTFQVADENLVLPPTKDTEYLPTLLDYVYTCSIDLLVPLIDPDLRPLAEARSDFASVDCEVLVSSSTLLDVTLDKWYTMQHFSDVNVRTPMSWLPDNSSPEMWPDPVFVKPRRGSASEGAQRASHGNISPVLDTLDAPMLQEVIEAPEITVDALFDFDGMLIHYVPRLRIRTLAGESIQGRTLPHNDIGEWLNDVLHEIGSLGARGPITLQAFLTKPEPTLSEINARFGGGFPLAHAAGGHYPEWIMRMCNGDTVAPRLGDYNANLCMTRAYTEWFVPASKLDQR